MPIFNINATVEDKIKSLAREIDLIKKRMAHAVVNAYEKFIEISGARVRINGELDVKNVPHCTVDTDKFLVDNGSRVMYRTGAEVLDDIGVSVGPGTENYLAKFDAAGTNVQDSQISDNGTGVNIGGTNYDAAKLEITDSTNPQLRLTQTLDNKYADIKVDSDGNASISPSSTHFGVNRLNPSYALDVNGAVNGVIASFGGNEAATQARCEIYVDTANSLAAIYCIES